MKKMPGRTKKLSGKIQIVEKKVPQQTFDLDDKCKVKFDGKNEIEIQTGDLEKVGDLGRGAYGVVEKMKHLKTDKIIAVKRIHLTCNDTSQKQTVVELDALMKSDRCPQMVQFYGAMFREGDVWICMEVMDISLDKFYKAAFDHNIKLEEDFIAKVAWSIINGLHFMKEHMELMHRDVKPSNILLDRKGNVKICDFGISGHLTESVAKTTQAGCQPYMSPERIEDGECKTAYDVRADVWSLGITIVEICNGAHPYSKWKTPFQQLKQVVYEPAPKVNEKFGYSEELHDFVGKCLTKDHKSRPKYDILLVHPFVLKGKNTSFDMGEFVCLVHDKIKEQEKKFRNIV
uniref:mitogen-activated protein kinase kinase n=1 Tax=Parastrongyloides trichosuri TaxID=131310 RepID=A0A0N4ZIK5_PARTI